MSRSKEKADLVRSVSEHEAGLDPFDYRVPDDLAERWLADVRSGEEQHFEWTEGHVLERIRSAAQTLAVAVSKVGPAPVRSQMPEPEPEPQTIASMIESMHDKSLHRLENKIGLSALSQQVSLMEEAIQWPIDHLKDAPEERDALNTYIAAVVARRRWKTLLRKKGIKYSTAKDRRARAARLIAQRLMRAGVPVR